MWWVAPLIGAIGTATQKAPPKYRRSEAEKRILGDLEKKAKEGFNIGNRIQQATRPALDIRDQSKSQIMGRSFQNNMQNSIITDELLRKVDRETQERVTRISNEIAMQNDAYKENAQNQLNQFELGLEQNARQSREARRQFFNQRNMQYANLATSFVQGGIRNQFQFDSNLTGEFDINNPPSDNNELGGWIARGLLKYDPADPEYADLLLMKEALSTK